MIRSQVAVPPATDGHDDSVSVMLSYSPAPDRAAEFRAELSRALAALRRAPGCRAVMVLGPPPGMPGTVCLVAQFDGAACWRRWHDGAEWTGWAAHLSTLAGAPAIQEYHGQGSGLVLPHLRRGEPPPRAKMAVVMWVSVYPTITALLWLLWPLVEGLPLPLRTLTLSVVMVPLMVWFIVPWVTACLGPWLRTAGRQPRRGSQ